MYMQIKKIYLYLSILIISISLASCSSEQMNANGDCNLDVDCLTVVIIEETSERVNLSSDKIAAINSQIWRDYVKKAGGQWRVVDKDADTKNEKKWVNFLWYE